MEAPSDKKPILSLNDKFHDDSFTVHSYFQWERALDLYGYGHLANLRYWPKSQMPAFIANDCLLKQNWSFDDWKLHYLIFHHFWVQLEVLRSDLALKWRAIVIQSESGLCCLQVGNELMKQNGPSIVDTKFVLPSMQSWTFDFQTYSNELYLLSLMPQLLHPVTSTAYCYNITFSLWSLLSTLRDRSRISSWSIHAKGSNNDSPSLASDLQNRGSNAFTSTFWILEL